ncbi:phospho-sugar mutase [Flavobacterium aquiphilum]|uniref:phospho-sugar mutase n=1 Tax=Flavobacterium aquiphilum TaxID=3003261 RepID=UPI002480DD92|nr:phospho-sugar mutase [Flavobacterium aquiphilum]
MNLTDAINEWFTPCFDKNTQGAVKEMMDLDPKELKDSFYKNLEFGTGGMRGIMGVGNNRINKYALGKSTQGISNYLKQTFAANSLRVVIAYDCRHNSNSLAKVVADVFSANGIQVYLFSGLRPTPELSFAVRYLNCQCGIVLTASHNPPEYNGYKVYWKDGGQIVPPEDQEIINSIEKLTYDQVNFQANEDLIHHINSEVDAAFIESSIVSTSFNTDKIAKENLNIVFTPLHGTAITIIPDALQQAGYSNFHIVEDQAIPNGDFPTVKSPNPEEPEALLMALELAEKVGADIVIGTDPDCDRLGIAVRNIEGQMVLLNGNQSMILMMAFLLEKWKNNNKINSQQFVGSTIVSTPMIIGLANAYGVECKLGLTGFKWIAKMIKDNPALEFIGGGEESFGFMVGDKVRDKDAVAASLLTCELAAQAKAKGSSAYLTLLNLYVEYGFYKEHLISITKKGQEGLIEIDKIMVALRKQPISEIDGKKVIRIEDYKTSIVKRTADNTEDLLLLPKADVLVFYAEDGSKIAVRPSGTEPKIKFYISVNAPLDSIENYTKVEAFLNNKIVNIVSQLQF